MQTTIRFPNELITAIKSLAQERGVDLSTFVRHAVSSEIYREEERRRQEAFEQRLIASLQTVRREIKEVMDLANALLAMQESLAKLVIVSTEEPAAPAGGQHVFVRRFDKFMKVAASRYNGTLPKGTELNAQD
jgi:hypothetical protein